MTKRQAIDIMSKCATLYHKYLENYQVVFVYRDSNNNSQFTEVQFKPHNFLHFTGVIPRKGLSANNFYRFALNNKLHENDFSFNDTNTCELKLFVLEIVMYIDTKARMIGDYNGLKQDLYTEQITGTTSACLGLIQRNNIYIPNSVLKEDIRSIVTKPPGKIYAIFKKKIGASYYTKLTYKKNNIEIIRKCLPKELLSQIDSSILEDNNEKNPPHNP